MSKGALESQVQPLPAPHFIPHRASFPRRLLARTLYGLIRCLEGSVRCRLQCHAELADKGHRPLIFCIWHNRLALALPMYEAYARQAGRVPKLAAMVSASRDGGLLARVLELFGTQPVRGSTSRRGPQALLELARWAERGYDIAITPDGPRGPRYVAQPGVIGLAQVTGCPVVPTGMRLYRRVSLRSWDRFQVPLPFSRVEMTFAEPMTVPGDVSDEQREALRAKLERRLRELNPDT